MLLRRRLKPTVGGRAVLRAGCPVWAWAGHGDTLLRGGLAHSGALPASPGMAWSRVLPRAAHLDSPVLSGTGASGPSPGLAARAAVALITCCFLGGHHFVPPAAKGVLVTLGIRWLESCC